MKNCNDIQPGMKVKVVKLRTTDGMFVKPHHLDARMVGATGTATGYVPGHGGDVWWVDHDNNNQVGAYSFTELEVIPEEELPKRTFNDASIIWTHWYGDRPDPEFFLGVQQGAKTVSKFREEFLLDWAKRWAWLKK